MPGRRRAGRLLAAALVAAAGIQLRPAPVAGHEELLGATTVFDRANPELPAGVRVQVLRSAADQLVLANDTAEEVEVLAETGEAFLRIGPGGTFANLASPTWYTVQVPEPSGVALPAGVATGAPARWEKLSDSRGYGWFDHRLHPAPVAPPAAEPGVVVRLADWRVPLRLGGRPVELLGHRQFTRLAGSVVSTIDQDEVQATGLLVSVASGRVPAVVLDASSAVAAGSVVVFGEGEEPLLRFTSSGTEANLASPTWALTAAARGGPSSAPAPAPAAPAWQRIAEVPVVTWLEPRAAYQPGAPPENVQRSLVPVQLSTWNVPVEVVGRRLALKGTSTWVPDPATRSAETEGGRLLPLGLAAAVVALGAGIAVVAVRRRSQPPTRGAQSA